VTASGCRDFFLAAKVGKTRSPQQEDFDGVPDMVGIVVKDMAKSLAFYRLVGLDIPEQEDAQQHVETTSNGYRFGWDTEELIRGLIPDWEGGAGRMALAFRCETPAAVDALHAAVVAAEHVSKMAPFGAFWGQRYAIVEDPDGNGIDLFCPL
jgi:catechol 2,3-dioxygenase-like lactoylglutathione lyase family enzyme